MQHDGGFSTIVLAVVFAGAAASAASATSGPGMVNSRGTIGTGSNTALVAGFDGAANLPQTVFSPNGSAVSVSCPKVDFKITSVSTVDARFDASFGPGCTTTLSGIAAAAAVDVNCAWTTFQNGTFNNTTGTGITVDLPAARCSLCLRSIA